MLTKHSLTYFLGRGVPGIINFLALSIYTHLVLPEEYGQYALVVTTVNLFNAVLFQWIRLVLLRFTPVCVSVADKIRLQTTVAVGYAGSTALSALAFTAFFYLSGQTIALPYLGLGIGLLVVQAFFEIGLDYYRANLLPKPYSLAHLIKSIAAIGLGSLLAYSGFGTIGLLTGLLAGTLLAVLAYFGKFIQEFQSGFRTIDFILLRKHLLYGIPLTASSALTFVMDSSDRYFVQHYLGNASTGVYSAGYDLAKQTLWVIMGAINLASYPLVIRALEKEGPSAADKYLRSNLLLLLGVALPTAIGLAVLAPQIATILVGERYASTVADLMPYIALGALASGIKSFYVDQSFQLAQKTHLQLWSVGAAALINVGLNLLLLPDLGLMGAAYTTLISYNVVLALSCLLSTRGYRLPVPWKEVIKILAAALFMGILLLLIKPYVSGLLGLLGLTALGSVVYGTLLVGLRVIDLDRMIRQLSLKSKSNHYA